MSGAIGLLKADALSVLSLFSAPQWGIFDQNGKPILAVDSVSDIEYVRDYDLSDYPQEQGAFETYNKVQNAFEAKLGFLINQSRAEFLQSIEAAVASLQLVYVLTPEISYANGNLYHYGYRRTQRNGVSLIHVDVWVREIRVATATQQSSSVNQNTGGTSYPVGQVNSNAVANPSTSTSSSNIQIYPLNTQSTNAATPASSGLVQPQAPGSPNSENSSSNPNALPPPDFSITNSPSVRTEPN